MKVHEVVGTMLVAALIVLTLWCWIVLLWAAQG